MTSKADWAPPEPGPVRQIERQWVSMTDGVRLAIALWLPETDAAVPVVLEAIPYRKRDSTRGYSGYWGRKLAQRGIGYARLDVRGSGDSEGLLGDEYLPQEQADAAETIAWLAAQPWCNGAVGMRGVSWGGFAALQTAALAPPALKAIMPMCASDRRYTDDAHYVGGAFALTGLKWATSFKSVLAGPPDPETFGPDWQAAWMARLEAAPAVAALWLGHQQEDDYWRQGSVGFDPAAIRCPVYLVGGWVDPYNEAIPRLLRGLTVPAKALIGPWQHGYPSPAAPGPGLDWIVEETRWWRQWLAGEDTGVMQGPRVWAYLPEGSAIEAAPGPLPGRWVAEPAWPPATTPLRLHPAADGRLAAAPGAGLAGVPGGRVVGLAAPEWVPFAPPEFPQEQSADDAGSLTFDGEPLAAPLDLLGTPAARLRLAAAAPAAHVAARLCEVTPDGRSWLVSYGVLNLTHRDSHAAPAPLAAGRFYDVELPLGLVGRRLRAGSRLRLALSESLWPLLWPPPAPAALTLDLAGCWLELPVREATGDELALPIPQAVPTPGDGRGDPRIERRVEADGWAKFEETWPASRMTIAETGTTVERSGPNVALRMRAGAPETCSWRAWTEVRYQRGDWDCRIACEVEIAAPNGAFEVRERVSAELGGRKVFDREHAAAIRRDCL